MVKATRSGRKTFASDQLERPLDCQHSLVRKGYYLGLNTEEYVCVLCGQSGPGKDWPTIAANQTAEQTDHDPVPRSKR
jgi:hypothetical protein